MTKKFNVAVVGSTGAVGTEIMHLLEERRFPVKNFYAVASSRSRGKKVFFRKEEYTIQALEDFSFDNIDIVLSSPGASVSRKYVPKAIAQGAIVIDNTSAFREDPKVPLIIPEVNPQAAAEHKGLISNPNCSTIQMLVALAPIHKISPIQRIIVSTYQAVSGSGTQAIFELEDQVQSFVNGDAIVNKVYPHQIAFNCLPHIDVFLDNLYSREEMKMVNETRKIMESETIQVSATTVRVPVFRGHSEAVWIETTEKVTPETAREALKEAPGVIVEDEPAKNVYPLAIHCGHKDAVYVGRLRNDISCEKGLVMWVVSDNIRKGAALNTVQIAELLTREKLL